MDAVLKGADPLLTLGVILVTGVFCGALARRLHLPAVTGQILGGMLIGESGLALLSPQAIHGLQPITHFALGLIAVAVGGHLNFGRLRNAGKRLALLLLTESTITPLLVVLAVLSAGFPWPVAVLFAALAVSTAPATIVALIKENRAKGIFVKTLVGGVALNNMACIFLFAVCRTAAQLALDPNTQHTGLDLIMAPLRQLAVSAALGGACGLGLVIATRRVVRSERLATVSVVAILVTAGLAMYLRTSLLLSALFLGVVAANLAPEKEELGVRPFADFEGAILAVFFTMAGMHLQLDHLVPLWEIVLLLFASRLIGKILAASLAMRLADATARMRRYLGLALLPQAGVAIGLILLVQEDPALAGIRDVFLTAGLTMVALNEIVGPILTRFALVGSGEAGKDRPRLIDFIREENIVTNFKAETKEDAIGQLTDLLIQTHQLSIDRDALLRSILVRESEMSTCVGSGLAIPHGELEEGGEMVGVMAISGAGLPFETPDGMPVHCIVLLATPVSERDRHLEVLAALMRAIGADPSIQWQLFGARSPAHAYELLHAEEAEDFNYFLSAPEPE